MPLDFNVSPYFDDFDTENNFYKILFRPGRPVQTREMNQIQSILQNQISSFGDHTFKNGTMIIPGNVYYDNKTIAVKLKALADIAGNVLSSDLVAPNLVGLNVVGQTSGVKAKVIHYDPVDENLTNPLPTTLYVKFISSGTLGETVFTLGERLVAEDDAGLVVDILDSDALFNSSLCTIDDGIYYVNGTFVRVARQTISIDRYSMTPTWRLGLNVTEEIISSSDDVELFDNALGYSNYGAPGADRYKISLILEKRSFEADDAETGVIEKFIDVLHVKDGNIIYKINKTEYAELEKLVARRTYEESGDYEVNPFSLKVLDYRSNDRGVWASGVAYLVGDIVKSSDGNMWEAITSGISSVTEPALVASVFKVLDGGVTWLYTTTPTYNSGVYNTPSDNLDTEITNSNNMIYQMSEGKAYIKGFEIEKQGKSDLVVPKATEFVNVENEVINVNSGIRVNVINMLGIPDINTYQLADIYYQNVDDVQTNWATVKRQATVSVTQSAGSIIEVAITDPGFGYDRENPPELSISVGTGAVVKLYVNQASEVYYAKIVNPGTGYTGGSVGTVDAPPASAAKIGSCRVRSCEYNAGSGVIGSGNETYSLEIFDIQLGSGYSWELHAHSIIGVSTGPDLTKFAANIEQYKVLVSGSTSITSGQKELDGVGTNYTSELAVGQYISVEDSAGAVFNRVSSLLTIVNNLAATTKAWGVSKSDAQLFAHYSNIDARLAGSMVQMPYLFVRSLRAAGDSDFNIDYSVKRLINAATDVTGELTITLAPNEYFGELSTGNLIVSRINGTVPEITDPIGSASVNGGGDILTITDLETSTDYEVLCTVIKNWYKAKEKIKTLTRKTVTITDKTIIDALEISLTEADIYNLVSVRVSNSPNTPMVGNDYPAFDNTDASDITSHFDWVDGQTMTHYGLGKLIRTKGKIAPSNSIEIVFEYFEHSAGDYFSVNSYLDIPYAAISPVYRDTLDFRPRISDAGDNFTGAGSSFTEPMVRDSLFTCDYSYYIPRKDLILLDSTKQFSVAAGPDGYQLKEPTLSTDAVVIADVTVAPGPIYANAGMHRVNKRDLRRFTMQDISKLEKRVSSLEYYTQLSLLESETLKQDVVDQNGLDRFKAGILTDDFSSQQNADYSNPDFGVTFDTEQKELRAYKFDYNFDLQSMDVLDTQRYSKNYKATGDLYTLRYTEANVINQVQASDIISVNPFDVITWVGSVNLYPDRDSWIQVDNTTELDVTVNAGGALTGGGAMNTVWNSVSAWWRTSIRSKWDTSGGGYSNMNSGFSSVYSSGTFSNVPLNTSLNSQGSSIKSGLTDMNYYLNGKYTTGAKDAKLGGTVDSMTLAGVNTVFNNLFKNINIKAQTWVDIVTTKTGTRQTTIAGSTTYEDVARSLIDPFCRARPIVFVARNLKPNTAFNVYFDERLVTDKCVSLIELVVPTYSGQTVRTFLDADIFDSDVNFSPARSTNTKSDYRHPYMAGTNSGQGFDVFWDRGDIVSQVTSGVQGVVVDKYVNTSGATVLVVFNTTGGNWTTGAGNALSLIRNNVQYSLGNVTTITPSKRFSDSTKPLSNVSGKMYGVYYLPYTDSLRFSSSSSKVFKMVEISNTTIVSTTPSLAAASYTASGQIEYRRSVTTNYSTIGTEQVTQTDTFRFQYEPVAQTFTLTDKESNGAYITSVDLYVAKVNASSSQPIIVEIRNTVNGYPGQEIMAVSELYRSQVARSDVTPVAQNFVLKDPVTNMPTLVFLEPGVEYSLVVRSEDSSWAVWIARMGQERKDAGGRGATITEQPTIGSFFMSQNASTWTADQYSDLTFRINKAKFITSSASDIVFKNKALLRETMINNAFIAVEGSSLVRVTHYGHGFLYNDVVDLSGVLSGPFANDLGTMYLGGDNPGDTATLTIVDFDYDSYILNIDELSPGAIATRSGYFGGNNAVASHQLQYNSLAANLLIDNPTNTQSEVSIRPMFSNQQGNEYNFDVFQTIVNRENVHFTQPMLVASLANEQIRNGTEKSFLLRVSMTSQDENLSPIIHYKNSAITLVRNRINDPDDNTLNNSVFDDVEIATLENIVWNNDDLVPTDSYFETTNTALFGAFDQIVPGNTITITDGTTNNVGVNVTVLRKENTGAKYRVYAVGGFFDEDGTTSTLVLRKRYVDETAPKFTSTFSTYMHKPMKLTVPSTIINVFLDINLPQSSIVDVYYRTTLSSKGNDINDENWTLMSTTNGMVNVSNFTEFVEYQFTQSDIAAFDVCQTKIVFRSQNNAVTPRVKNLRVMALA